MEHQSQRASGPDIGWPRSCLKASITQRVVAEPGATFGWHSHPGENVNVVVQGTVTLYHDEDCVNGVAYPAGSAVPPDPDQVHLARNLSETETLIMFATYFAPKTTPTPAVRVDAPLSAAGCPE
jgi:quercetin dioxygenase-like cupin family protein